MNNPIPEVSIYIETSIKNPRRGKAAGMWIAEYITSREETVTRSGIIYREDTTENALTLELMKEAFSRLRKPCLVLVNTQCRHILNTVENGLLPEWKKAGWISKKNKPVKNAELWKQIYEMMQNHGITMRNEWHSFRMIMQENIQKELNKH